MNANDGFSHFDAAGRTKMVDVGMKPKTARRAVARSEVKMAPGTLIAIRDGTIAKGAVLGTARLAGVMAAKKTADLIPLCHPLEITAVAIEFEFSGDDTIVITSEVAVNDRTGAEMEALCAASVAALTIYDMAKAVDRAMEIRATMLIEKSGGKTGHWTRSGGADPSR